MMKDKINIFRFLSGLIALFLITLTGCNNPLEQQFVQSLTEEEAETQTLIKETLEEIAASANAVAADTTAPAVSFVNPIQGQYYSGILLIAGVAADASAVTSVETKLDSGSWESQTPGQYWSYSLNTGLITEGSHTLYARATDEKGNASSEASVSFTVDRDVPDVTITSPSHGDYVKGSSLIYEGTSADNLNVVSVSIIPDQGGLFYEANGTTSWTYGPFDTTTVTDGTLVVLVEARDDANNRGTESIAIVVDNTSPTLTVTSPAGDSTIETAAIDFSGTVMDAVGVDKVEVQLDSGSLVTATLEAGGAGDVRNWNYSFSTSGLTEGAHTVTAVATDLAGNISTDQTVSIYFDTTPPVVTISSPADGEYRSDPADINITGTVTNLPDAADTVEFSTDGTAYSQIQPTAYDGSGSWSHTLDVSAMPDGATTVYIRAADTDTMAWDEASVSFFLDRTDPSGAFSSPAVDAEVYQTVQVNGSASDNVALASVNPVAVYIENVTTPGTTATYNPSVINGLWSAQCDISSGFNSGDACIIHLTITDETGNSTQLTRNITITDTVPSGTITSPANGDLVISSGFTVTGTASGGTGFDVVSVEVMLDGRAYAAATDTSGAASWATWEYTTDTAGISPDGYYNLTARITNNNGVDGVSIEIPITIEIDNTAPVIVIDSPTPANTGDSGYLYGIVNTSGTATDEHLNSLEVFVDGATQGAPTGTDAWTFAWNTAVTTGAQNGTVFRVTANDTAGNTGETTVTVDVRPYISGFEFAGSASESVLTESTLTILGDNFRNDLPAGTPVFNTVFSSATVALAGTTFNTTSDIDMTVPAGAVSGNVYVEEGDDTGTPIQSNSRYLHIWKNFTGINGVSASPAMALAGTDRYLIGYVGGAVKQLHFSQNGTDYTIGGAKSQDTSIAATDTYVYLIYNDNNNGGDGLIFKRSSTASIDFDANGDPGDDTGTAKTVILDANPTAGASTSIAVDIDSVDQINNTLAMVYKNASGVLTYKASTDNGDTWPTTETVDTSGITSGQYSEIAFDSTGSPVVAYFDETNQMARFAYRDAGGVWQTTEIETAIWKGEYISMAVDSSDGIHVSYYDSGSGDLKYAYASSKTSAFSTEIVDETGIVGMYTGITIDDNDYPHISYYNNNYATIHYAYWDGSGSWEIVDFPTGYTASGASSSAAGFGSDGFVYIGYTDGTDLKVLQYRR